MPVGKHLLGSLHRLSLIPIPGTLRRPHGGRANSLSLIRYLSSAALRTSKARNDDLTREKSSNLIESSLTHRKEHEDKGKKFVITSEDYTLRMFHWNPIRYPFVQSLEKSDHAQSDLDDAIETWRSITARRYTQNKVSKEEWESAYNKLFNLLSDMRLDQLIRITVHLSQIQRGFQSVQLNKVILNLCISQLNKLSDVSNVNLHLRMSFVHLHCNMKCMDVFDTYIGNLSRKLLSCDFINAISPSQFTFTINLARIHGHIPGNENFDKHSRKLIPDNIRAKIVKHFEEFSTFELGVISDSLWKCKFHLHVLDRELNEKLLQRILSMSDYVSLADSRDINRICKLLKTKDLQDYHYTSKLAQAYEDKIALLSPFTQLRLLHLINQGQPSNILPILESFCLSLMSQLNVMRMKDLEQFCYILWYNNYTKDMTIYSMIEEEMEKKIRKGLTDLRSGHNLIVLCHNLVKAQRRIPSRVDEIFKHFNTNKKLKHAETEEKLLFAVIEASFSLVDPKLTKRSTKEIKREMKMGANFRKAILTTLVEIDYAIELLHGSSYNGERLDVELRQQWQKMRFTDTPEAKVEVFREKALRIFRKIYGSHIVYTRLYPFATFKNFLMCLGPDGETKEIPSSFVDGTENALLRPDSALGTWVAVVIPRRHLLRGDNGPTGVLSYNLWVLERLGYKVYLVRMHPFNVSEKIGNLEKRIRGDVSKLLRGASVQKL